MSARPAEPLLTALRRGSGAMATAALGRMEDFPWYRAMPAEDRSWVGLVAQAGIAAFVAWCEAPEGSSEITADVFGTAPRELTRSVSLQQTLELLRTVVDVVEEHVDALGERADVQGLREAILRYSREVAFAAAGIYATAAESRGAWDARLEALVVDSLIRGESDDALRSRAAALGWVGDEPAVVVVGTSPGGPVRDVVEGLRRRARGAGGDVLVGVQGDRLVVVVGRCPDPVATAAALAPHFGGGAVVVGPVVAQLALAHRSARAALAGIIAARGWQQAPRPVPADDLLPERILSGDATARRTLIDRVYRRLADQDAPLLETVAAYLEQGRSLEATARTLFVHPNTVRYRLRRVADVTGWDPLDPREGFVLQVAITVGRLSQPADRR